MSDWTKASEEGAVRDLLEVTLTDVLKMGNKVLPDLIIDILILL